MGYVAARCPSCGGDLQLDDSMEKGYCTHCGTPIYFKEAISKVKIIGPVEIAGFAKLDSLIKLIKKDLEYGMSQTDEFRDRLNRALELDPGNQYLYDLQSSKIWNAQIINGKLIEYKGSVEKIVVPDCVTRIARFAFKTCHKLKEIVLPRSVIDIENGAFFKEDKLIISAYMNTYAARYALISPAFLNIIDDDDKNQEHIRKIEILLSEIVEFKISVERSIKAYYNHKIFSNVVIPYIFFAIIAAVFFVWPVLLSTPTGKSIAAVSAIIFVFLVSSAPGYTDICRKIAKKNQIMNFYKKSNDLLGPLGIIDFKYLKNIWECSNTDLNYESNHLEKVKKQILSMDTKQFIGNTDINLSLFSYIAGKRPKGLDDF